MEQLSTLLQRLFALHRFGIRPGLERIEALLHAFGNPHRRYPAIHVTGTNGKGSVCAMTASALLAQGYRVGLYTSPHLCHFSERIRIAGKPVAEEALATYLPSLLRQAERIGATFFEVTTALAFILFAEYDIEIAVVEVGMGGRYDATNVLSPLAAVVTSIDYDHEQYLGSSLQEIAWQKAGIFKPNCAALIGERRPWLQELLYRWAAESSSTPVVPSAIPTLVAATPNFCQLLRLPSGTELLLPLAGEHQRWNLAITLRLIELLSDRFPTSMESLAEGLQNVRHWGGLRARIEPLRLHPPLIVDVAHNPSGIAALLRALDEHGYSSTHWHVVFGAMADKDISAMLRLLQPRTAFLYACAPRTERALPPDQLVRLAHQQGIQQCEQYPTVADAVQRAYARRTPTLVVGSFYLVSEALEALRPICTESCS